MKDLENYLSLPWTIIRGEEEDDGRYLVLRIAELPGFVVAARTEAELFASYRPALEAFLASYLDEGEEPPVPASPQLCSA